MKQVFTRREIMDTYIAENPELLDTFTTDDKGRITLGIQYADKEVKVVVLDVSSVTDETDDSSAT